MFRANLTAIAIILGVSTTISPIHAASIVDMEEYTADEQQAEEPVNNCSNPSQEDITRILEWIKNSPEYTYLIEHGTIDPCWRNGCFLRRAIIIKILQEIFSDIERLREIFGRDIDKPFCASSLCYITQVYPETTGWSYHTVPGLFCTESDLPYDPSGRTEVPLRDLFCIETYGRDNTLNGCCGLCWAQRSGDTATCNTWDGRTRPPAGSPCDVFVHQPNCTLLGETLDQLKERSVNWCSCSQNVLAMCAAGCASNNNQSANCIKQCTKTEQNRLCYGHLATTPPTPHPSDPVDCSESNGWGAPQSGQTCPQFCMEKASEAKHACLSRGSSEATCEKVYTNAMAECLRVCVECIEQARVESHSHAN